MASQDMTFCTNKKCKRTKCERHQSHIDWSIAPPWRSYADFEGTKYCINKAQAQKGEIARLNKQNAEQQAEIERLLKLAEEQNAEIKRLQEARNKLLYGLKQICKEQDENNIRAEAIKEFAERLKKAKQYSYERHENIVPVAVIDWIVKEMVGDAE